MDHKRKKNKLNKYLFRWSRLAHFRFDITIIGWIRNDGRLLNSYGLSKLTISTHQRSKLVLQRKNQHSVSFMRCDLVSFLHTDLHCISFHFSFADFPHFLLIYEKCLKITIFSAAVVDSFDQQMSKILFKFH